MSRITHAIDEANTFDIQQFSEPPRAYLPVPFWSWNEQITPDEAGRQLTTLAQAGMNGGFIHPRVGLTTPYLGDEWFRAIDAAIDAAKECGVNVWLYDEDKWPSGYSGGTVPLADENYRLQAVFAAPADADVLDNSVRLCEIPNGNALYKWTSPLGDPWFNGTCYGQLISKDAMRRFLDDAYEPYYQRYGEHFGGLIPAIFTDEPCAIFRNRLPRGAVPFGAEVLGRFRQMHGYDAEPLMGHLYMDGPGAARFRLHYYRTINDLFENNFSKQLGDWCAEHNIDFTGHYMAEEGLYMQQTWGVKIMPNYRHQSIPGIDHLGRQIYERLTAKQCQSVVNQFGKKRMLSELYGTAGAALSFEDRWWIGCQQVLLGVNLFNHHLTLYTMSGCRKRDYPQNMFYQQPWWDRNKLIDKPIGRLCYAMSRGKYLAEALVLHPQESAFALWRGHIQAEDTAGKLSFWDWEPTAAGVKDSILAVESNFLAVIDTLLGNQKTFDLADETILQENGSIDTGSDGRPLIRIGESTYPILIMPSMATIRPGTVDLIRRFMQAGGPVLLTGDAPAWLDGEINEDLNRFTGALERVGVDQLPARLEEIASPAVKLHTQSPARPLTFTHIRALPDGDRLVLLVNLHRTEHIDAAPLKIDGRWSLVERLDLWTGSKESVSAGTLRSDESIELTISLEPAEAILLRLSSDDYAIDTPATEPPVRMADTVELPPEIWRVERVDDNAITLDMAAWREGDGEWSAKPVPVIAIQQRLNDLKYDGSLSLRYTAHVADLGAHRKINLVVEHPEWYRIFVNGKEVAYAGLPYWRDIRWMPIDITGLLKPGDNTIEMHNDRFRYGDLASVHDTFRRYGTEIESIYLVGDFHITAETTGKHPLQPGWVEQLSLPPVHTECMRAESLALAEASELRLGDTTVQGLPFYAGRLKLQAVLPDVEVHNRQRVVLRLAELDAAVADVTIGDQPAGHFIAHPFEVDITEAYSGGERAIRIELYSTLRNLMGPHHHPSGELSRVYPSHFTPDADTPFETIVSSWPQKLDRWIAGEYTPPQWEDSYCVVSFGRVCRIWIELRE